MTQHVKPWLSITAALALSMGALAACGEREAESETGVAEAEVKTDLPESAVSDAQLQGAADAAAANASSPPTQVIAVPVPAGGATGAGGAVTDAQLQSAADAAAANAGAATGAGQTAPAGAR